MDQLTSPRAMRRLSGSLLVFFFLWTFFCLPVAPGAKLAEQVWYVTLISHVALVLALLSWWQSTRVEVRQAEDSNVEDVERKVEQIDDKL